MSDDAPDLDAQLDAMPPAYIECRDLGHTWAPRTVDRVSDPQLGYYFAETVRCARCGCTRSRTINSRGYIVGNSSYVYPADFLVVGHGRMTLDDRAGVRLRGLTVQFGPELGLRSTRGRRRAS